MIDTRLLTENERQMALIKAQEEGKDISKPIVRQMVVAKAQLDKADRLKEDNG